MTQYDVSFSFSLFILCALHEVVLLSSENLSAIQFTSNQPVCQLLHHLKALYSLSDLPEHICYLPAFCHIKKSQCCCCGTFKELTDFIYKLSVAFPFFSVCWLFSYFFLTCSFLKAETLLRKHLACMEKHLKFMVTTLCGCTMPTLTVPALFQNVFLDQSLKGFK